MSDRSSVMMNDQLVVRDAHTPNGDGSPQTIGPRVGPAAGSVRYCQEVQPARGSHSPLGQKIPQSRMYSFQNCVQAIEPGGKLLPLHVTAAAPTPPAAAPAAAAAARVPSPGSSPAANPPAADVASSPRTRRRETSCAAARVSASNR